MRKLIIPIVMALAACGSVGNGADSGSMPPEDSGISISDAGCTGPLWPIGAVRARITLRGFWAPACRTDGGWVVGSTYEIDLLDAGLDFEVCHQGPVQASGEAPPVTTYRGRGELTAAQFERIDAAMRTLECGPRQEPRIDGSSRVVELNVDGGIIRYEDQSGSYRDDTTYIRNDGVKTVLEVLDDISGVQ